MNKKIQTVQDNSQYALKLVVVDANVRIIKGSCHTYCCDFVGVVVFDSVGPTF